MGPTVADYRTSNLLILRLPAVESCHGRGREFESRRPRHTFQKSCTNFNETNKGAKGCILAPLLHLPQLEPASGAQQFKI